MSPGRSLSAVVSLALPAVLAAVPVRAFTVSDLPNVRCVCNYLFQEDAHNVDTWRRDLDNIKAVGFNTVWIVNVWAAHRPDVDDPAWREDRIEALRGICQAAAEREMDVLLVLAYIGEGWGPKGVDVPVWPLVAKHRQQHLAFLRRMAKETREFDNVFYLLCSEEILPATLLYRPGEREECVASFRAWARKANPDLAHWNERWATDYTWDSLVPADTKHRPRWQLWADHSRWFGYLMRELLPPMVEAIREQKPGAIIGYHDFLTPKKKLGLTVADGGFDERAPVDFYSIGYYYKPSLETSEDDPMTGLEPNLQGLREGVERARDLYPELPIFCGELGMAPRKEPPAAREADEAVQAEFLSRAVEYLAQERIGFDIWAWRTVVDRADRIHSLVRPDGSTTPALRRLKEMWRE